MSESTTTRDLADIFAGRKYVSTDGQFEVDLSQLHINTWIHAFTKAANHVFGNEAISKAAPSANKGIALEGDERAAVIRKDREKNLALMVAGTWGDGTSTRMPKVPGLSMLEQIENSLIAERTRQALAKAGFKPGEAKDTWIGNDGIAYPLDVWMGVWINDPDEGETRKAEIKERAQIRYQAKKREAELAKAAKEREATRAKPTGEMRL